MTNPYRNINELREWLKANSSGDYRPAAHSATVIEEQESEITTLRAENDRLRAKLAAMESQEPYVTLHEEGEGYRIEWHHPWTLMAGSQSFYAKPEPADKPARITEQDALEILSAFEGWDKSQFMQGTYDGWFKSEGHTLLNKLNADREKVPAVTVTGVFEAIYRMAKEFKEAWPEHTGKYYWMIGCAEEFRRTPSHSQQSSATDAERFCDSHCTWRDHHPDCPSHESEPSTPDSEGE